MTIRELSLLDRNAAEQAAEAVDAFGELVLDDSAAAVQLRVGAAEPGEERRAAVPAQAFRLFVDILEQLARGNAVTVAPVGTELTTQQAANLLNVSRPYLIGLLEEGRIPYRRVGNRRKVLLTDLLEHRRRDEARRRKVFADLTVEAQELDLGY